MEKSVALQLMQALTEEEPLGVAGEEAITRTLNLHFIRACLVARPELPHPSQVAAWAKNPRLDTIEARNAWALFFSQLGDALYTHIKNEVIK